MPKCPSSWKWKSMKSSESAPRSRTRRLCAVTSSGLRNSRSATNDRMTASRASRSAGGAWWLVVSSMGGLPVAQDEGRVLAPEAEGVRQDVILVVPAGRVGDVVQVAGRVRVVQVDGGVDPSGTHAGD